MATKVLSNEFMQNIATEEAWKELSSNFSWSEAMLEKYQDKVNWDEVTENRNIRWTTSMIQKFQKKINWEMFSRIADDTILTESNIETFKERWNWHELSNNSDVPFTEELLEKYADKWDWEQIIDWYHDNSLYSKKAIEFYEKYKDYIPVSVHRLGRIIVGKACSHCSLVCAYARLPRISSEFLFQVHAAVF